jgi:hypothetical protein
MTDEIAQLLKTLHLGRIAEIFDDELVSAQKKDVAYQELIARLLRAQWHHRQESALAWRIRQASLPEQWSLESFPWKRQPGVSPKQIRAFAELDFVGKAENIVFVGPTDRMTFCTTSLQAWNHWGLIHELASTRATSGGNGAAHPFGLE